MNNRKRKIFNVVLVASLLVFLVCVGYFGLHFYQQKQMENLSNDVTVSFTTSEKDNKVEVPVNFKKLKKTNSDIYAWIRIPGLDVVDYPILRHPKNNEYYLKRSVKKEWSVYGSIFTEDYNSKDFSDFNTLVYGHNMKNGTMFGSLKKFRDASFFEENRYIYIYMENRILKYEIFAACTWDNKHILATRNFDVEQNRNSYLDDIFSVRDLNSQIKKDIEVTSSDRIITLSTCMNDKSKRFIVSGVLIYDSQNP
jgi:sortase B